MSETPLLVGVREAAQALGLGRDSTYQLVRESRLHAVRVGRRVLIPRTELEAFVERETQNGAREEVITATKPSTKRPLDGPRGAAHRSRRKDTR